MFDSEGREPRRADAGAWLRMRVALWPDGSESEHREDIARFLSGNAPELLAVLVAEEDDGRRVGFAELSIRPRAEGCHSTPVAYLEGRFVEPHARRLGIGRTLVAAAEESGRSHGCSEFASDAAWDNQVSAAAHRAAGFTEVDSSGAFERICDGNVHGAPYAPRIDPRHRQRRGLHGDRRPPCDRVF